MKRKNIHTTLNTYLFETHINKDGELGGINFDPSSNDLWDEKTFLRFVNHNLEYGNEMPEKFYKLLSDNHKRLYRKELLDYGGQMIGYSENKSLLKDLFKYDYDRLEKETMEWIELFPEMGDNGFPVNPLFIKNIDEILQGRIILKLIKKMEWEIHLSKELFDSFHPRVQDLILKNEDEPFVIEI
jgi:hypothetical protein